MTNEELIQQATTQCGGSLDGDSLNDPTTDLIRSLALRVQFLSEQDAGLREDIENLDYIVQAVQGFHDLVNPHPLLREILALDKNSV